MSFWRAVRRLMFAIHIVLLSATFAAADYTVESWTLFGSTLTSADDPVGDICRIHTIGVVGSPPSAPINQLYYKGFNFSYAEFGAPYVVQCYDLYDNNVAPRFECKTYTDDGRLIGKSLGPCPDPTPPCVACAPAPDYTNVNLLIGNPVLIPDAVKVERAVDWRSSLDPRFSFLRGYRSDPSFAKITLGSSQAGAFMFGGVWRMNFDDVVEYRDGQYRYRRWTGETVVFAGLNSTQPPSGGYPFTIQSSTTPFGTRWVVEDGTGKKLYFGGNASFRSLREIVWPDGYTIIINRNSSNHQIISISDNRGQRANFTWSTTAVPNSSQPFVTRIDIDPSYVSPTFAPDVALVYTYEQNTVSPTHPKLDEISLLDIAASTSEVRSAYDYIPDAEQFPPALTTVYDGRRDGSGQLIPYTEITYQEYTGIVLSTSHPNGADAYDFVLTRATAGGRVSEASVTNALGHESVYRFELVDDLNRVDEIEGQATTNILGTFTEIGYVPNVGAPAGFVYSEVAPNGSLTTYERNARGLITTMTEDAAGSSPRITTFSWHGTLRLPLTRTTASLQESFTYDSNGLLLTYSQTDILGGSPTYGQVRTWTFTYTSLASGLKVLTSLDGPGDPASGVVDVTTFAYTTAGRLTSVTDPNGVSVEILSYDAMVRPSSVRDGQGFIWNLTYDIDGRLIEAVFDPAGAAETSTFDYDIIGQMISSTDSSGRTWDFAYDEARRLIGITAPVGETITFDHDALGNVTATEYADVAAMATYLADTQYDALGRILALIGSNSQTTTFAHDVEDNVDRVTDAFGLETRFDYDALNRMTEIVDRANFTTTMGYDAQDRMTSYTDGRAITTSMAYNGFGEVVSEVSPDRGTLTYAYNSRGLVTSMMDGRGVVTNYAYDNGGRITAKTFPSQPALNQTFTYYASPSQPWNVGRMAMATDATGSTAFAFDPTIGDLASDTRMMGGVTYVTGYDWIVRGELASTTYPSGATLTYAYDGNGNLESLTWVGVNPATGNPLPPQPVVADITYAPFGDVLSLTYGGGGTLTATYDTSYRLTSLMDVRSGTTLRDITYGWTTRDDLASVTDALSSGLNETYDYTPEQFLMAADGPWGAQDYAYDGAGNRLSLVSEAGGTTLTDSYSYPTTNNRLTSITLGAGGTRSFTQDASGNVTADSRTGQAYSYTYDAAGRMATLSLNGTLEAQYGYSFLGQQVVRNLVTAGQVIHAIHDQTGNRIAEYLYDPATSTSTLIREYIWANDRVVGVFEGGVLYFVRTDHISRPVFATDSTGAVVWSASYLPFGGVQTFTGTPISLRFPGQWFQAESGLHQNWMRDYDPTTGRYLQADPLGLVDGASVYGYALQNPLLWVDPEGEDTITLGPFGRTPGQNWVPDLSFQHEGGVRYVHLCSPATLEFHFDALEIAGGHWHYYPNGNWLGGGRKGPLSRLWDLITKSDHLPPYTIIVVPDCVCVPGTDSVTPQIPPTQ